MVKRLLAVLIAVLAMSVPVSAAEKYDGEIQLSTPNVSETSKALSTLTEGSGGKVSMMQVDEESTQVVLKIPTESISEFTNSIQTTYKSKLKLTLSEKKEQDTSNLEDEVKLLSAMKDRCESGGEISNLKDYMEVIGALTEAENELALTLEDNNFYVLKVTLHSNSSDGVLVVMLVICLNVIILLLFTPIGDLLEGVVKKLRETRRIAYEEELKNKIRPATFTEGDSDDN